MTEIPETALDPKLTVDEIANEWKFDRNTVQRLFLHEPGVIGYCHASTRQKRQYFTLRIPRSVAQRVFERMTVKRGERQ